MILANAPFLLLICIRIFIRTKIPAHYRSEP